MNDRNLDRLKELVADEKFDEAITLLARINEKHAKTASDFIALAKTYGKRGDFARSEKLFKKAYRLRPSKLMYHDVMDVCLETGHIKDAEEYLAEYEGLPSHDEYSCAVYNYKILKKKDADRKTVIEALEKINAAEYTEKWAYELAKQYYKAGMETECKGECEKIVKAFEYSPVSSKAKMLLAFYNGEVTAEEIKNSVPSRVRRMGEEVREAEMMAHPEEERLNDKAAVDVETAVFTEVSPDDMASAIIEAESTYGLEDIAKGVRDIIDQEMSNEPVIEEISAEHSDPEIEEISAEHSDPEIEEISAEHSDPEIEEISAEHSDPEIEEISAEHSPEDTEEKVLTEGTENGYGPEDFGVVSEEDTEEEDTDSMPHFDEEWYMKRGRKAADDEANEGTEAGDAIDDEQDIKLRKRSKSGLEEGFMRELNSSRFERSMPQYVLYAPKMNFSKSEIKEGKLKSLILENNIDLEGICKNFFRIDDVRRSILKSLELAANERGGLCFVITGDEQTGKSTLALAMIRLMYGMGIVDWEKTAKIKGEKLNRINLADKAQELKDCNILVENAGELSGKTLRDLVETFGQRRANVCLILEDNMKSINGLFRNNDEYNGKFNNRIHLPKFGTDELMGFAYDVFDDADYSIEAKAADVFKKLIVKKNSSSEPKLPMVIKMAEETVARADERLAPDILKMAAEATIENFNLIILESDIKP